jgi:hypothetical protein
MSILYCAVINSLGTLLIEVQFVAGNFNEITNKIFKKLEGNLKDSYDYRNELNEDNF